VPASLEFPTQWSRADNRHFFAGAPSGEKIVLDRLLRTASTFENAALAQTFGAATGSSARRHAVHHFLNYPPSLQQHKTKLQRASPPVSALPVDVVNL